MNVAMEAPRDNNISRAQSSSIIFTLLHLPTISQAFNYFELERTKEKFDPYRNLMNRQRKTDYKIEKGGKEDRRQLSLKTLFEYPAWNFIPF